MKTRIILGAVMIAALAGLLWLDWHIQNAAEAGREWAHKIPLAVPLVPLVVVLTVAAFREIARLARARQVRLLFVSGLLGALGLAMFPFLRNLTVMVPPTPEGLMATRGRAAVVGSETTYGDAIRRLDCGYVCRNTRDWLRSIRRLVDDSSMRERMGTTGYDRMMASETYEANAHKWMAVYREVLSS